MRINFDFLDLEAFLAVKETASFHAASEQLHLSQSSVTRRVQKLEDALGTVLFERTTRAVRPTLAAKRLQLRAEAILQDAQETTRAMRDDEAAFAAQRAQIVTLATVPTVVAGWVGPALKAFRAAGNTARVRVLDLAANDVAEAVAQGEADFGICSVPLSESSTDFELLFSEPIVLVLPKGHLLAERDRLVWSDLAEDALILPARGTGNRLVMDEALARSDRPVRWTYEVGRSSTALDLVAQGVGIALLPQMAVQGAYAGLVDTRPMSDPQILRPIGFISRIGQSERTVSRALKQALLDHRPA
ncbi:MAG: LysR family transcriptional regulator [Pseudomonadota bacterium]